MYWFDVMRKLRCCVCVAARYATHRVGSAGPWCSGCPAGFHGYRQELGIVHSLTYTHESARFISTRDDGMLSELPEMTILASGNARLLETLSMEQFVFRVRLNV